MFTPLPPGGRSIRIVGALLSLALLFLASVPGVMAAPPDLTTGGTPPSTANRTINLGPTGLRGWVHYDRAETGESRQILITEVDPGSPADGVVAVDDVILGADGTGAVPANFTFDARRSFADAIADAEANNPAILKVIRWRDGVTTIQNLTLAHMGAYAATAPYNCPKSSKILEEGVAHFFNNESSGRYTFGAMALLAVDDLAHPDHAAFRARLHAEARALIPDAATRAQMMSDEQDTTGMVTWQRGHTLVFLAEYYLVTGDAAVLPAIEAYAVNIAKNQSLFGTVGHKYADKNLDGSANGPMGGVYGVVNSAGMPCFLGVLLAKECGLTNPELGPAIEASSRFYAYYANRGAIPYGEHEPGTRGHENNGKSGLAAVAFALQANRAEEQKFFAKMCTASGSEREIGHTGAFFNYLWAPLGAAAGGEAAAAAHFSRISWYLDLHRRWDGGFEYDCLNEGPNSGSEYNNFRMSTVALLTYALPLRKLHLTGRGHDPGRWLTSADVAEALAADGYEPGPRSDSELIGDLGSWSPTVQRRAAEELATRSISTSELNQITTMATDPRGNSRVGACLALGKITNSSTANDRAATLAGLLTDADNHVRFMAAEAMRYLPASAKQSQLNAILAACASTAQPLTPYDEEDPLHFAHSKLAVLLFYSGNAYGPRGVIYNDLTGVDRDLLYPAIRAVAATPVGFARSTLNKTYRDNLSRADVEAVADAIVDSVRFRAPADKMFSSGVREGGIAALQKYGYAEGVPLSMIYMVNDERGSAYTNALGVLENYAGGSTTVSPDPDVVGFCEALLGGSHDAAARAVLEAIDADPTPAPLTPFKSVQSVIADNPTLTLPVTSTVLRTTAVDLAGGDSVYTWRKVHGVGAVTFDPNGTGPAAETTVTIDPAPGQYLFEVTMSDSRGLTEVVDTVALTLFDSGGGLPPNTPPTADPQFVVAAPAADTSITLTGSDPEGYPLGFAVTVPPANGSLGGTAPNLVYTPSNNYLGPDSFTFEVMDSEGQTASATVTIDVTAVGIETYVYEPFDYPTGPLAGQAGGTGLVGAWADGPENPGQAHVHDESTATTPVTYSSAGGPLSWDGVVDNLPTSPATGARFVGLSATAVDKWESYRPLAESAGAMAAGNDNVLWVSAASHFKGGGYGAHFGLALATNCFTNRTQNLSTSSSYGGSTAGDGIGVGGAFNSDFITPVIYDGGGIAARTTTDASRLSTSVDNVVILKFVFGRTDAVYACSFLEWEEMDEATFNERAVMATGSVDENALDVLTFSSVRGAHALDEIRIGNSFAAVIGVEGSPADTIPPTLADVDIVDNKGGASVMEDEPVTYTVTFSEPMAGASVDPSDFENNPTRTATATIDSVSSTPDPAVFEVVVMPVAAGTLQLQVKPGAGLNDPAGNPLDTTVAIVDVETLTVVGDYGTWAAGFPGSDLGDPNDDLDGDLWSNNEERVWGLDPTDASSADPTVSPLDASGVFSYTRRDPALTGLTFTVWTSTDLVNWAEDLGAIQNPGAADANGVETVEVTLSPVLMDGTELFYRVKAEE